MLVNGGSNPSRATKSFSQWGAAKCQNTASCTLLGLAHSLCAHCGSTDRLFWVCGFSARRRLITQPASFGKQVFYLSNKVKYVKIRALKVAFYFLFMYLEKLEIQGFKSFARHSQLVFNRELTAIVGPNGSGKSNIADAVRWVLGEQSSKTLRGKKAEDVIFVGSDKKSRLGFAEVSLYLNNSDKSADVEYDQIIITRRVNRDASSEYLINNNKVRLLDVQLLLAKANFGQKTYSVIGQGTVDSILISSAAERKEFFDEATGVRQFQIKKEQAISKMDGAKENLEQTKQIILELEPHLRTLTRQVHRLEKREKITLELQELQTQYYNFLKNNLEKELKETKNNYHVWQTQVSELNQQLVDLQTSLDKEAKANTRQNNFEILQKSLSQEQAELNALLKDKTILEGQSDLKLLASGQADIVWLKKRVSDLENQLNKANLKLEGQRHQAQQAKDELVTLEKNQAKVVEDFQKLEKLIMSNQQSNWSPAKIAKELEGIIYDQQILQDSIDKIESLEELGSLKNTCQQVSKSLKNLGERLQQASDISQGNWQQDFNKLLTHKDTLVGEIAEARAALSGFNQNIKQSEELIISIKDELLKLEHDRKLILEKSVDNKLLQEQLNNINQKINQQSLVIAKIEEQIKNFNAEEEAKRSALLQSQKSFRDIQQEFNTKNAHLNEIKITLAKLETRQEDLLAEIAEEIPELKTQVVKELEVDSARQQINNLKNQLQIIGGIDPTVASEFTQVNDRFTFLSEQSKDLEQAIEHLEKIIKDLDEAIAEQFDQAFHNINKLFDTYFKKLFNGGKAELILDIREVKDESVETEDGEEEVQEKNNNSPIRKQYGIEIKATPPGKRLSSINMLSGGEKALTSIALICAIIANNPSPFVVLDEVDAALDEANSVRFSQILAELSNKTQFIAITHNRATMQQSRIIYGVTMGDDSVSKLLSVNFDEADKIAA